jgi:exoribonuclease II
MHDAEEVLTLDGFCKLRRELDAQPSGFLDSRIRRFQSFAEISTDPGPTLVWASKLTPPGPPRFVSMAI